MLTARLFLFLWWSFLILLSYFKASLLLQASGEVKTKSWEHCLKGPLIHLVSSPAQNGAVANTLSDFLSGLELWAPNFWRQKEKAGITTLDHPLGATNLFVQSGLIPFARICFLSSSSFADWWWYWCVPRRTILVLAFLPSGTYR